MHHKYNYLILYNLKNINRMSDTRPIAYSDRPTIGHYTGLALF